jgi:hypothetical protein
MAFPLFKDISKNANDLLKKGYPTAERYAFRVEFDSISESGVQFLPFLQETADKNLEGELKTKAIVNGHQITTTGNLKEDVSFEISPSKAMSGLKWTLNLSSNMSDVVDKAKGKLSVDFKSDVTTSSLSFEHPFKHLQKSDDSKINVNTVFGSKERGVSVGVDTDFSISTVSLKTINAALSYNRADLDISIFMKRKLGGNTLVGTNFFQALTNNPNNKWKDTQVAGELTFDLNDHSPFFTLGAACKPADFSSFKARFDSKGLLGFVYTDKWSGPLSVSFGSDWNVLGASASPLQYSIKLAFK